MPRARAESTEHPEAKQQDVGDPLNCSRVFFSTVVFSNRTNKDDVCFSVFLSSSRQFATSGKISETQEPTSFH